jgi:hypothetical protein
MNSRVKSNAAKRVSLISTASFHDFSQLSSTFISMSTTGGEFIFSNRNFKKSNAKSQILLYELELKEIYERYKVSPSKERAAESFRILGELIPLLGPFSGLVEIIKDELFRSVYSQDLTSKALEPYVERIPYFKAVGRLQSLKKDESIKMKSSREDLDQKLKFRNDDLVIAHRKTLSLKYEGMWLMNGRQEL